MSFFLGHQQIVAPILVWPDQALPLLVVSPGQRGLLRTSQPYNTPVTPLLL
jgi:hypothetical protein